jgi:hypothetical protein
MKRQLNIITILFLLTSPLWSQDISTSDSLEIRRKVDIVFESFENPDFTKFKKISTDKIYCIICFSEPDFRNEPYMLDRKDFFKEHLEEINKSESFIRAKKSKEIILVQENKSRSDITAFITTWKNNEFAVGHEGAQLGIYFKKIKGEFKFAGIETIP